VRTGDTWALKATFQESASPAYGEFGKAVAISNNLAIVSSAFIAPFRKGDGRITRFSVDGNTLTQLGPQTVYWPEDRPGYSSFGEKVIITPSYVFVSAPNRHNFIPSPDIIDEGAFTSLSWVFAFPRQGANGLSAPVALAAYDRDHLPPPEFDLPLPYFSFVRYGSDIAVSGSTLAVGSELFKVLGKPKIEEGRVYTYDIPPWTP
jgi:hypothetical protein